MIRSVGLTRVVARLGSPTAMSGALEQRGASAAKRTFYRGCRTMGSEAALFAQKFRYLSKTKLFQPFEESFWRRTIVRLATIVF